MNYVRRLFRAVVILAFLICAWCGAEMLIYGESQRSAVDMGIAILIALRISGGLERGVEANERKRASAEKFADEFAEKFIEQLKKEGEKTENGET